MEGLNMELKLLPFLYIKYLMIMNKNSLFKAKNKNKEI